MRSFVVRTEWHCHSKRLYVTSLLIRKRLPLAMAANSNQLRTLRFTKTQLSIHIHKDESYFNCPGPQNYVFHCSHLNCLLIQCSSGQPLLSWRWSVGMNAFPPCVYVFHEVGYSHFSILLSQVQVFKPIHPAHAIDDEIRTLMFLPRTEERGIEVSLATSLYFVLISTIFDFLFYSVKAFSTNYKNPNHKIKQF